MLQELLFYQGIMTLNFTEMKWDYSIGKNGKIENNGMDCLIEWFRQKRALIMLKNEFSTIQNLFLILSLTRYMYNNELNKTKQMIHHKRTEYKEELLQVKKRDNE